MLFLAMNTHQICFQAKDKNKKNVTIDFILLEISIF